MAEYLYDLDSVWIAAGLFAGMVASIELGHWIGRQRAHRSSESQRVQANAMQSSMLGLLALVLGFTFSLALERYDERNAALAEEATAIGTAYARAGLLPGALSDEGRALIRGYVDLRVAESAVSLDRVEERRDALRRTQQAARHLNEFARRAVDVDGSPVRTGLFVQALHAMLDAFQMRESVLSRHVPEVVLWLLFLIMALTSVSLGFSSGVAGHRPPALSLVLSFLCVLVTFLVIDLDRPRRGLIQLRRQSLIELQLEMMAEDRGKAAGVGPAIQGTGR